MLKKYLYIFCESNMLIKKIDSLMKQIGKNCTVREYKWDSEILSIAQSIINGRLPEKWAFINHKCEEMYFVISGKWKIYSDKWEFDINEWDVYHFEKWEKYFVWWDNLKLVISNSPQWYPEQFEIIE